MKKFFETIFALIPHAVIVISLMMVTFYITDRYNRAMAFINNDITKTLLLVLSILAIAESVYVIYCSRRRKWEKYKAAKRDEDE